MTKNLILDLVYVDWAQIWAVNYFFIKHFVASVTRYHGELSSCKISEKTNDLILRKFSEGRTDGQTDGHRDRQRISQQN